jgi:ATP-dependent protease ClpP protease subunit
MITINRTGLRETTIEIEGFIGSLINYAIKQPMDPDFESSLQKIKKIKTKKIVVNIRSTGGNIDDAIRLYTFLEYLRTKGKTITTNCFGYVGGVSTIIAQGASRGKRKISKNGLYLIYNELDEKFNTQIASIYSTNSNPLYSIEYYRDLMGENDGHGRWLTPEETINAGLADKIII